ncbi:hypothetical protein VTK73DRAFT_9697 [Phialemonium thermophilum]|uniref:AA1-like domain-containing protein n=1 Tax=Phialemonium thermophilum TaxID=223376 RepID=A0ABR3W0T6_9PEZI
MATKDRLAIALLLLVTVLVGGVLVDPLQSLPIPRPPVHDDDGNDDNCTAASLALHHMTTYQVILAYTNSSTCDNTVVFQLYNPAISVDAQCAAYGPTVGVSPTNRSSSSSSLAGDGWHSCFVESRDPRVAASFRFDFARREVTVNETWVCDDAGDGKQSYVSPSSRIRTLSSVPTCSAK